MEGPRLHHCCALCEPRAGLFLDTAQTAPEECNADGLCLKNDLKSVLTMAEAESWPSDCDLTSLGRWLGTFDRGSGSLLAGLLLLGFVRIIVAHVP